MRYFSDFISYTCFWFYSCDAMRLSEENIYGSSIWVQQIQGWSQQAFEMGSYKKKVNTSLVVQKSAGLDIILSFAIALLSVWGCSKKATCYMLYAYINALHSGWNPTKLYATLCHKQHVTCSWFWLAFIPYCKPAAHHTTNSQESEAVHTNC